MKKQIQSNRWKIQLMLSAAMMLAGTAARAEMITVGGDQTAGTGTLTINQDITFTINTAYSGVLFFMFDEIVPDDGSQTHVNFSGLTYSINGSGSYALNQWVDNINSPGGDTTPNDGYIYNSLTANSVSPGDTVTLHAGTGTMDGTASPNFNPWSSGNYSMFIVNDSPNRISNVVPEPSVFALSGLVGIGVLTIRRIFMI